MTRRPIPSAVPGRDDRGAALMLALAVLIIGGLVTAALAGLAMTTLRTGAVAETRAEKVEAAEMAIRIGIAKQRELGASRCVSDQVGRMSLNGITADLRCETLDLVQSVRDPVTGKDRMGVTITSLDPNAPVLSGGSLGSTSFDGVVYVAGGDLGSPPTNLRAPDGLRLSLAPYPNAVPADPNDPRGTGLRYKNPSNQPPITCATIGAVALSASPTCETTGTWWEAAGQPVLPVRVNRVEDNRQATPRATIGTCRVYYPGTYRSGLTVTGSNPVYFASGVYYVEGPVVLGGGARIVGGGGQYTGCTTDADAAFDANAPADPLINGRGVTFVFGGAGSLLVKDNSTQVLLNRRVGGPTTTTTSGWSIVGVHPAISTPTLEAPAVKAANADGSLVDAAVAGGYTPLTSVGSLLVDVDLKNSARFTVRSGIYAASSTMRIAINTNSQPLDVTGGVTLNGLAMPQGPMPQGSLFGLESEPVQRTVRLTSTAYATRGAPFTSVAIVQVADSGAYAINSWRNAG